jgi:hypothetical protein
MQALVLAMNRPRVERCGFHDADQLEKVLRSITQRFAVAHG